jgi:cytochrome c oxidase subunit 3
MISNIQKLDKKFLKHPFHIVDPSPWPFLSALGAFSTLLGLVLYMHFFEKGFFLFRLGIFLLCLYAGFW